VGWESGGGDDENESATSKSVVSNANTSEVSEQGKKVRRGNERERRKNKRHLIRPPL
jgi:hypothetical protein